MYLDHFGLSDFPFIQSAKDELFFASTSSKQHCADIHHWLDAGHGMLLVAGEQGVGGASLAHHALDTTATPVLERYVISGLPLNPVELLQSIAIDMGLVSGAKSSTAPDIMRIRHQIRSHLRAQASLSRRVCLVVHDAHRLSVQTLAYLEDLGKDHTFYLPLCHIILLVDKGFAAQVIQQKRLTGARHVYNIVNIKPLKLIDTHAYIEHRLEQAGLVEAEQREQPLFSTSIIKTIHQQTKGKPQLINALCDLALVDSCREGAGGVSIEHIRTAIHTLGWKSHLKAAGQEKMRLVPVQDKHNDSSKPVKKTTPRKQLGALEQSVHELISGVTTIGRAPDCTIRIDGDNVSPYQALIVRTDDGMFIRNEGSEVPLYLNGSRVESANLNAGDKVSLGSYRFSVDLDKQGTLMLLSSQANGSCA